MTLEGGIFVAVFAIYLLRFNQLLSKTGTHWLWAILESIGILGWLLMLNRGKLWFLP